MPPVVIWWLYWVYINYNTKAQARMFPKKLFFNLTKKKNKKKRERGNKIFEVEGGELKEMPRINHH